MKQEHSMDNLLTRYLTGNVSASERLEADRWINENDEHQKYFEALKLIWDESECIYPFVSVSENEAWERMQARRRQDKKPSVDTSRRKPFFIFRSAAAILLLATAGLWWLYIRHDEASQLIVQTEISASAKQTVVENPTMAIQVETTSDEVSTAKKMAEKNPIRESKKKLVPPAIYVINGLENDHDSGFKRKEAICNNTPCPIEICIVQSIKCGNGKPTELSLCSMLEPDIAGHLHYKDFDGLKTDCEASVDEITITMVSTGETIVLNKHSQPATAQDFFHYLTGRKKGNIQAGVFESNCDNYCSNLSLRFDNRLGDILLQ